MIGTRGWQIRMLMQDSIRKEGRKGVIIHSFPSGFYSPLFPSNVYCFVSLNWFSFYLFSLSFQVDLQSVPAAAAAAAERLIVSFFSFLFFSSQLTDPRQLSTNLSWLFLHYTKVEQIYSKKYLIFCPLLDLCSLLLLFFFIS